MVVSGGLAFCAGAFRTVLFYAHMEILPVSMVNRKRLTLQLSILLGKFGSRRGEGGEEWRGEPLWSPACSPNLPAPGKDNPQDAQNEQENPDHHAPFYRTRVKQRRRSIDQIFSVSST